jgi:Phosphatidylinositol 3- and 4-kinase
LLFLSGVKRFAVVLIALLAGFQAGAAAPLRTRTAAAPTRLRGKPAVAPKRLADLQRTRWNVSSEELRAGQVTKVEANAQAGTFGSEIVTLKLADGRKVRGIFKPVTGEQNYGAWAFSGYVAGTLYKREIAASRISDELGFHVVPPTVQMKINGRVGSLQLWIEHAKLGAVDLDDGKMEQTSVLDALTANGDRHAGNILTQTRGGMKLAVAIDNGLSFHADPTWGIYGLDAQALSPATQKLLLDANPKRIAQVLAKSGIGDSSIVGVLTRLATLQGELGAHVSSQRQIKSWVAQAR